MAPEPYKHRFQANLLQIFDVNTATTQPVPMELSLTSPTNEADNVGPYRISPTSASTNVDMDSTYNPLLIHHSTGKHSNAYISDDSDYIEVHSPTDNIV